MTLSVGMAVALVVALLVLMANDRAQRGRRRRWVQSKLDGGWRACRGCYGRGVVTTGRPPMIQTRRCDVCAPHDAQGWFPPGESPAKAALPAPGEPDALEIDRYGWPHERRLPTLVLIIGTVALGLAVAAAIQALTGPE